MGYAMWPKRDRYAMKKSDNLQYNTLIRLVDGTNDLSTKCLIDLGYSKLLIINKLKGFFAKNFANNFARFYEKKNNTWNIRRLVDEMFVTSARLTSILYSRLMDFHSLSLLAPTNFQTFRRLCISTYIFP